MQKRRRSLVAAVLVTVALSATAAAKPPAVVPAPPLRLTAPESQGMSPQRLARLHAEVEQFVRDGKHAGAITLVAGNGRIVDWQTWGKRDLEAGLPMEKDTICRIDSMAKSVKSVASRTFRGDDPLEGFGLGGAVRIDVGKGNGLGSLFHQAIVD